jgi:molybdenum cofactor cytidylyltransferase
MPHKEHTAGIILAAGMSLRFGQPKQLLKLDNKILLEWVLDAALASRLAGVVLVLGHEHQKIMRTLGAKARHPRLQVVINHRYREGQSTSLQAGLLTVQPPLPSVMFLLGDQPMLKSAVIDQVLGAFWLSEKDIGVPVWRTKRGNPAIFSRAMYAQLMAIEGDVGARNIIRTNPEQVLGVEVDDPLCFMDIDSPQDYEYLQRLLAVPPEPIAKVQT